VNINGGTADQKRLVRLVAKWQPALLSYIENVWPGFYVNVNYGGQARDGYFDTRITYTSWAFAHITAHEFCHEVQLASDHCGDNLGAAWLDYLAANGHPAPYNYSDPMLNPWEALAENMRRALYTDLTSTPVTPNTSLIWVQSPAMVAWLREQGLEIVERLPWP
jgi:hypothetical protein